MPYESRPRAAAVVRPADTEQVSAVLRHCVRRRLEFTPQSDNTGLVQGSTLLETVVTQLAERQSARLADVRFGQPDRLWALRHSSSEGLRAAGPVVGFDLSFRRSEVAVSPSCYCSAHHHISRIEVGDFGHVADVGVHFNLVHRKAAGDPARVQAFRDCVLALAVNDFGASFTVRRREE